jgi:polysaccharide pyruvyl transferase CsaB
VKRSLVSIFGYFGFANTGDEAILHCMLSRFREMQKERPGLELVVYSVDPTTTEAIHQVAAVPSSLPPTYFDFIYRFVRGDRKGYRRALKMFIQTDVLVVGGGGLFFDHSSTNLYFKRLLAKIAWAKRLGKRVAVFGVGVGPIHHEESRRLLRKVLSKVDLITVRDAESHRLLDEIGVAGPPIHTTADFVYLLEGSPDARVCEIVNAEKLPLGDRPRVAVCIYGDQIKIDSIRNSLLRFCEFAVSELGADIWFVPMQTGGGFDDRVGARQLVEQLATRDNIHLVEGEYSPWESQGLLGRVDAVLGMRLHGVILALNNATPVFGISYMPKVERAFDELGHPEWQLTPDNLSPDGLIDGFRKLWSNRESIKEQLRTRASEIRRNASSNFSILSEKLAEWQIDGQ